MWFPSAFTPLVSRMGMAWRRGGDSEPAEASCRDGTAVSAHVEVEEREDLDSSKLMRLASSSKDLKHNNNNNDNNKT